MSGYAGDLSPAQEDALKQMKEVVADVHQPHYDDHYYLRWLRAREFDVKKAETMMRKNLLFRRKIGADTILTDYIPNEIVDKYYPRGLLGPDKEGCPVRYMPFKNMDFRGFVYSVKKSDVLKFLTYLFEQDIKEMEEWSKKIGKNIEKHSYIVDLEGYTFRQAANRDAINMLNEILKLYEANYPDRMKIVYFINAPVQFNWVLNFSKPFISENTLKKFRMYGKGELQEFCKAPLRQIVVHYDVRFLRANAAISVCNYNLTVMDSDEADFKSALLNAIDAEILPKFLGGTRKDPDGDPTCKTIINYGGMIPPEKYVINGARKSLVGKEGVASLKVPSQSYRLVDIRVEEPNSRVEWLFETSAKDVAVGLYQRIGPREEDLQEILPTERVNSHLVPESGAFLCQTPGTYVLKFDNSYSWMFPKKVFYQIKVVPAAENDAESDYD